MNDPLKVIGQSIPKKRSRDKVHGTAKYTADILEAGTLHIALLTSPYGHARILDIDTSKAKQAAGVRAVLIGRDYPVLTGEEVSDRPVIATDKVRYYGEIVAVLVADSEAAAKQAALEVEVRYEPLPTVGSPTEALAEGAPLVHERLDEYEHNKATNPVPGTNIASVIKIRKGEMEQGWHQSDITVSEKVAFGPSDHAAMETRSVQAEIREDGQIVIETASQVPFAVKDFLGRYFGIDPGWIIVNTPLVGGAYGGKTSIQLELIAYLASKAAGGRKVKLVNTREHDMTTSPVHIGLEATVKLGCTKGGKLTAAEIIYHFDGGAYSDKAIDVSRAAALDCTGPYAIERVKCDSVCVYTNHPYATAFRGYGHSELTFAMERTMDKLAEELSMDPLQLRLLNAVKPGDISPTRNLLNASNLGDIRKCLNRLQEVIGEPKDAVSKVDDHTVRATGISCFWKNSSMDNDATSGATILFNIDGSINLLSGVVEIGTGTKTVLAQILAERFKMDPDRIHVQFEVDTEVTPEHWKTVASRGTFMAGRAVLEAAEDAIAQLKDIAAAVLRTEPDDLEIGRERIFVIGDPSVSIAVRDICYGYVYPNGNTIGGQIIGRGNYVQRGVTNIDPETGAGLPGPEWGVGAQAVEVELDTRTFQYRILRAVSIVDAGRVLNPKGALGQLMGAMCMGLGFASRETLLFNPQQAVLNDSLRDYNLMRYGENPQYTVEFTENPCLEAPYGARGLGEHGLIGMPAALASALSRAAGVKLTQLPLVPELIWRMKRGESH